ncbi:MAG: CoA ester lyase [Candidatus Eisenbacteria bacterium]|nr:CoA ester lyase [Candidatus Eisenbacteria bacterium]
MPARSRGSSPLVWKRPPGAPTGQRLPGACSLPRVPGRARRRSGSASGARASTYPATNRSSWSTPACTAPDGIILDLEDSVAPAEKDAARLLVRNALRSVDFGACERMVRINQLPMGFDDLEAVIPENVHVVLIPKCESAQHVHDVEAKIRSLRRSDDPQVFLMPILETALGVLNAFEIATASRAIVALTIGLEDYTADIGTARTEQGAESLWARSMVINAARAAGVAPIDSVYSDVMNTEGLRASVLEAKALGFEGKGCIHPGQIRVIHEGFAPTAAEIERATKIVRAFEDAEAKGLGVVSLGSKMIDAPVVKRANRTVRLAIRSGKLAEGWRDAQQA